jgi:hypothetical protein
MSASLYNLQRGYVQQQTGKVTCPSCSNPFLFPPNCAQAECPTCHKVMECATPFGDKAVNDPAIDSKGTWICDGVFDSRQDDQAPLKQFMDLKQVEEMHDAMLTRKHTCWLLAQCCCMGDGAYKYFLSTLEER